MNRLEYALVTLKNKKQYFVLEDVLYNYDTYDLILNVEDENDIRVVRQDYSDDKAYLTPVTDKKILKVLASLFIENISIKQKYIK